MEKLPQVIRRRIAPKIEALTTNPRPLGCVKIAGTNQTYRIRIGDYRVVYEIHDDRRIVIIFVVAHRRESYRGL